MTEFDLGRAAGSRLLNVEGAPAPGFGERWDWAMDVQTGNVYEKTGNAQWTCRGCLKGKQGETGPGGPRGEAGRDGAVLELNTGVFAMTVDGDGHLLVQVNAAENAPPLCIDGESGHLIYRIQEGGG